MLLGYGLLLECTYIIVELYPRLFTYVPPSQIDRAST